MAPARNSFHCKCTDSRSTAWRRLGGSSPSSAAKGRSLHCRQLPGVSGQLAPQPEKRSMKTKSMMWAAEPLLLAITATAATAQTSTPAPGGLDPYDAVSESLLWSFAGSPDDGANPTASLIADKSGNIYTARHSSAARMGTARFRRPDRRPSPSSDDGTGRSRPGTFDLLGFTHYWVRSQKGYWVLKQKTAANRLRRAIKRVAVWCQRYRHQPVREQWTALRRKLLGHFAY